MSSKVVYHYRIFCITENKYVYAWGQVIPVTCPDNTAHLIDPTTISVIETIDSSVIFLSHDTGSTLGRYRAEGKLLNANPSTITTLDMTWAYDITVFSVGITCTADNKGDVINSIVGPDTIVGYITQAIAIGTSTFTVSPTVLQNAQVGFICNVLDSSSGVVFEFGEIRDINIIAGTVTCEFSSTLAFNPGCLFRVAVNNIRNYTLPEGNITLTNSSSFSSNIPKGTVVRVSYKNQGTISKEFYFNFQYYY
jgi:hypothetical protein